MKFNVDTKGIRFKTIIHLLIFTLVIIVLVVTLQIWFIDTNYEELKTDNTEDTAAQIASVYTSKGLDEAVKEARSAAAADDMFIVITRNGERRYPAKDDSSYAYELSETENNFRNRNTDTTAIEGFIKNASTERRTFYYAEVLDKKGGKAVTPKDETENQGTTDSKADKNISSSQSPEDSLTVLYILSPIYPQKSIINIMQRQLGYVALVSLILAILIGLILTRKISEPLTEITGKAAKLAEGQYGVNFQTDSTYSEITELAETMGKMSNELERSSMLQRDLMANVSHDLRTPLTMIKSYAEMIRDLSGDIPEKRNAHLDVIIEESDRLNSLVNDMLALSAMQAGTLSMNMISFNIHDAVDSILAPYRVLEEKEGYTVHFNCREDIYVEGDEERIKQVISNLLSNAVKYCGHDKTVFINIRRWGKKVHFEVIDHGVGIKPEELSHIWDRYYKTSSNHVRPTRGSGLGLSIVKEILVMHGAKYGVESKVGKGTTVWFELNTARPPQ